MTRVETAMLTLEFCGRYALLGVPGRVLLTNTCDGCKIISIVFVYLNGTSEIQKFRLQGHQSIEVDIKNTTRTQIIDEQNC